MKHPEGGATASAMVGTQAATIAPHSNPDLGGNDKSRGVQGCCHTSFGQEATTQAMAPTL